MAQAPVLPRGFELPLEPRLPRIGSVDQVAVEARAAELENRVGSRETELGSYVARVQGGILRADVG